MKKFIKTAFFSLIILSPYLVLAGGLVKCDGTKEIPCDFNALINLAQGIIKWIIVIAPSLAALTFAYAGFLYMSAGANPSKKDEAHKIFTTTLLGLLVILAAWLVVYAILKGLGVMDVFILLKK